MKKSKQGSFIEEIRSIRGYKPPATRKPAGSQPVSPDPDQDIRTDFNRQRGLKAPAPDKLPKTFSGNLDLDELQRQQKALRNKKAGQ